MLNFIGIGSAFNPEDGNASAYFIKDDILYLIDCGELVFKELLRKINFNELIDFHIFITHTHSDHVGSLGSLISYLYHHHSLTVRIYHGGIDLADFLNRVGISENYYKEVQAQNLRLKHFSFVWIESKHSNMISSFGLLMRFKGCTIYYSGDSKIIPNRIYQDFMKDKIDLIYQDVTIDSESTSHLTLENLSKLIPESKRHRIIAMHLEKKSKKKIRALGFELAEVSQRSHLYGRRNNK